MLNTILPTPKRVDILEGQISLPFAACCQHTPWHSYLETLQESFEKTHGIHLDLAEGGIHLIYDPSIPPHHYHYEVKDSILLSASDDEGILYAIATVLQAFPKDQVPAPSLHR